MRLLVPLLFFICSSLAASPEAEFRDWTLTGGNQLAARLHSMHPPFALMENEKGGHNLLLVTAFSAEDSYALVEPLEKWLEWRRGPRTKVSESASDFTKSFANHLVVPGEGKGFDRYQFSEQLEPDYYAFYYSAHWCGPCRRFTPELVRDYNRWKAQGFDRFQVIFVSSDEGPVAMRNYMLEAKMPWPALRFNKTQLLKKFKGNGIPCLVVTDNEGNLIMHSYRGKKYLGPSAPKDLLNVLLTVGAKLEKDGLPTAQEQQ